MFSLEFDYLSMNDVMKVMKDLDLPQKNQDFSNVCRLDTRVRLSLEDKFRERIADIRGCTLIEQQTQ